MKKSYCCKVVLAIAVIWQENSVLLPMVVITCCKQMIHFFLSNLPVPE